MYHSCIHPNAAPLYTPYQLLCNHGNIGAITGCPFTVMCVDTKVSTISEIVAATDLESMLLNRWFAREEKLSKHVSQEYILILNMMAIKAKTKAVKESEKKRKFQ